MCQGFRVPREPVHTDVNRPSDIPKPVLRFLAEHVDSVGLLDTLLLLRASPEKRWTPEELGRALVTSERLAAGQLRQLTAHGLAVEHGGAYSFDSSSPHDQTVASLAECYARRRHTVISAIYGGGTRAATSLADAFRLRREDG
jgi:hypothetical protein